MHAKSLPELSRMADRISLALGKSGSSGKVA